MHKKTESSNSLSRRIAATFEREWGNTIGVRPRALSFRHEIMLARTQLLDKSLYKLKCSRDGWKYFAEPTFPTALLPTVHSPIVNRFPEPDRGFTFAIEWDRGPPDSTRLGTAARENLPINNVPWIHPLWYHIDSLQHRTALFLVRYGRCSK